MMRNKFKKSVYVLAPFLAFSLTFGCTPKQTETAKTVLGQVVFYSNMAKTLIEVAKQHYQENEKVSKALEATQKSLKTLESLVNALLRGLEKDDTKLVGAVAALVGDIFVLIKAIQEAKSSS